MLFRRTSPALQKITDTPLMLFAMYPRAAAVAVRAKATAVVVAV